jgi:outer membrane protein
LDLDSTGGFDIEVPDLSSLIDENYIISPVDLVYSEALKIMPEVRGAEFRLKSSEQDLKIAKGARSPRLSLNGSWGTVYSDARSRIVFDPISGDISQEFYPFWDQLGDSRNWGITLGMSIPIFNGWMVNSGISNARLNIENFQYELKNTRNLLYKEIQQAYADATAALKKFRASEKAVASMIEAFRYTEQKFNVGLLNSVDYNTSKNLLTQAQSELLQAKYEYVFYINVLEFYKGNPIEF